MACAYTASEQFFLVVMGMAVFLLQAGFACLECGSVRVQSVVSILFKNVSDVLLGSLAWFAVGYAFAFGDDFGNKIIGLRGFFLEGVDECSYAFFFFQWTFAATATTIISGALAERAHFVCYVTYSLVVTGIVYPVVVHWAWSSQSWLESEGSAEANFTDFAGSAVVHVCGGTVSLVGAWLIGPRIGRFGRKNGGAAIPGHSVPMTTLGGFLLIFGFLAFNGGSVLTADTTASAATVARAVVNTVLALTGGGLSSVIMKKYWRASKQDYTYWSIISAINGTLGGMVSICASADSVQPWAALVIGIVGGIVFQLGSSLLVYLQIDDPVEAIPVHLFCGVWGVIAQPFFEKDKGIFHAWDGDAFKSLGWNLAGLLSIMSWCAAWGVAMFVLLKKLDKLRISKEMETVGIDQAEHGGSGFKMGERAIKGARNDSEGYMYDSD